MEHRDQNPTDHTPDAHDAEGRHIHYTPGAPEDNETAVAYANRTGQHDTTSLRPERSIHNAGAAANTTQSSGAGADSGASGAATGSGTMPPASLTDRVGASGPFVAPGNEGDIPGADLIESRDRTGDAR